MYRLKAEKKGALAFRASLKRAHDNATVSVEDGTLVLRGVTSDKDGVPGKVRYTVLATGDEALMRAAESLGFENALAASAPASGAEEGPAEENKA